jgi:NAD(P)H dehydrogenase (quinone)
MLLQAAFYERTRNSPPGDSMSRVLIVFAHPSGTSFNRAVLERLVGALRALDHTVKVCDLYAERFDPLMTAPELHEQGRPPDVHRAQQLVLGAEVLFFVYPTWWWTPPAMLKGWLERVICIGFAFRFEVTLNRFAGLLEGRRAFAISTGSADPTTYAAPWQADAHREFVKEILAVAGVPMVEHLALTNVHQYAPPDDLLAALDSVERLARRV